MTIVPSATDAICTADCSGQPVSRRDTNLMSESTQVAGSEPTEVDVAVIGTGFAGLYALQKFRNEMGLKVQGFENAGGVGGTWWWNRYPGARADTEVTAYCYSFDRDMHANWKWSERYPRQPEILSYLESFARRFDLNRSVRFNINVVRATFEEHRGRWLIETDTGEAWSAQFIVEGVGLLSSTNYPEIPGIDRFEGRLIHTSRWPHEGVDMRGRRVAVIGTGSSGVQVITEIAPEVKHLTVLQRTPQYVVPAQHGPLDPDTLSEIEADYDGFWEKVLASVTAFGFDESQISAGDVTPEQREAIFERQWQSGGGFQFMFATFNDIGTSREANDAATDFIRRKISQIVEDPETAQRLTPHDLYAKRPICCDNYYETYNRDNVTLLDVKADPIVEFTARGIRTESGEHEFDIIVFATGFDAVTGNYLKIDHRGRRGLKLREKWADRPHVHLGLMSVDFPNLFMIFGPMGPFTNQPPAHEFQVNWAANAVKYAMASGTGTIEPTPEAEEEWMTMCDDIAYQTLFPRVNSWINGANVPGKPVAVMFYMGGMGAYAEECRKAESSGYEGFIVGRPLTGLEAGDRAESRVGAR